MRKTKLPAKYATRLLMSAGLLNDAYGRAFNGMVTLNFEMLTKGKPEPASRVFTKLNEAIGDYLNAGHKRLYLAEPWGHFYVYVHEWVRSHGHHVHELISAPPAACAANGGLHDMLQAWARKNYGRDVDPHAVHFEGHCYRTFREEAAQQKRLLSYILKACEDAAFASRDGLGTTLHALLNNERYARAYAADVARPAGQSQNLGNRAWFDAQPDVPFLEDVLTDRLTRAFHSRREAERFNAMLRALPD